jgi:hypothetical protein
MNTVMIVAASVVAGAVLWHLLHTKVAVEIAALKTDVAAIKTKVESLISIPASAMAAAPALAAAAAPAKPVA